MPHTDPHAPRCDICETALAPDADPRRRTCSDACRSRAYRKRRALDRVELAHLRHIAEAEGARAG